VIPCDHTMCYSNESVWFQHLTQKRDELLPSLAFNFNSRRYAEGGTAALAATVEAVVGGLLKTSTRPTLNPFLLLLLPVLFHVLV